ncbi:MAG: hypothetical protein HYV18_03955 [Gammaproteobacteria bacterium]|nr:hypothetical protein [Gammaproteobacteria bacterium]
MQQAGLHAPVAVALHDGAFADLDLPDLVERMLKAAGAQHVDEEDEEQLVAELLAAEAAERAADEVGREDDRGGDERLAEQQAAEHVAVDADEDQSLVAPVDVEVVGDDLDAGDAGAKHEVGEHRDRPHVAAQRRVARGQRGRHGADDEGADAQAPQRGRPAFGEQAHQQEGDVEADRQHQADAQARQAAPRVIGAELRLQLRHEAQVVDALAELEGVQRLFDARFGARDRGASRVGHGSSPLRRHVVLLSPPSLTSAGGKANRAGCRGLPDAAAVRRGPAGGWAG